MPIGAGGSGGGGGRAGDVRAGGAYYEVFALDKVSAVLDKIQARVQRFAAFMRKSGLYATGAGLALGLPILGLFHGATSRGAQVTQLADQFRVPIQVMNRLKYAADQAGVSVGEVMSDTTGRFRHLINRAPDINPSDARSALHTQQAFRDATLSLQNALLPLTRILTPIVEKFSKFVQANAGGVTVIAGVAAGLFVLGTGLTLLGTVLGFAVAGVKLLFAGLLIILSPIGLLVAGLAALTAHWATTTESGRKAASDLGAAFRSIGETFGTMWQGIIAAVKTGNLEGAFKIAAVGIKAIWYEMLVDMGRAFAAWLNDHRDKIIALGALLLGIKGAKIGARFGPVGALFGAGLGAAGGGFGADALVDALAGIGDNPGLEAKAKQARAELAKLAGDAVKVAATPAGAKSPDDYYLQRAFNEVKGGFNVASSAQQFGYGNAAKVDELTRQIALNTKKMAEDMNALLLALKLH